MGGFSATEAGISAIRTCSKDFLQTAEELKTIGDQLESSFESLKHGLGENYDARIEILLEAIKDLQNGTYISVEYLTEMLEEQAAFYEDMLDFDFGSTP